MKGKEQMNELSWLATGVRNDRAIAKLARAAYSSGVERYPDTLSHPFIRFLMTAPPIPYKYPIPIILKNK